MTSKETLLLSLILDETKRVETLNPYRDWFRDDPTEWVQRARAINDLARGLGVRVQGDWLGTDAASRKARQRVLESLERAGLVSLAASWGSNRTHVKLTPQGREMAERLGEARVLR